MKVSLRFYASLHDYVGERDIEMELDEGATVDDLRSRLAKTYPGMHVMLMRTIFAVDDEYVSEDEVLREGVQVSLIPPVSGGAADAGPAGLVWLTYEALEPHAAKLAEMVRKDEDGAVAVFYGVVRNHSEGRSVDRLEYEAHETMARRKLEEVAAETKRRYPAVTEIGIWHRIGMLEVGEASLLVALSSAHRAEAFEACHWSVDFLKETVPIWKKEHWSDGAAWVEGHPVQPPETASR